jgi:hypothetical protein
MCIVYLEPCGRWRGLDVSLRGIAIEGRHLGTHTKGHFVLLVPYFLHIFRYQFGIDVRVPCLLYTQARIVALAPILIAQHVVRLGQLLEHLRLLLLSPTSTGESRFEKKCRDLASFMCQTKM